MRVKFAGKIGVRIAAAGEAVAAGDAALGDVQLGLVGDVADGSRLGAGAEQRALRSLQHFNALHVGRVYIQVSPWELSRLIVQVDGDVREAVDRAA